MAGSGQWRWGAAALVVLAAGCKQSPVPLIDGVGVEARGVDWTADVARKRFSEKLFAKGAFRSLPEGADAEKTAQAWNLRLALLVGEPPADGTLTSARAEARLSLESGKGGEHEVFVTATAKIQGPGLDEWREAARQAASDAMASAAEGAAALVGALGKTDRELISLLDSKDAAPREWAAAVLAQRKNPAALDPLVKLLATDDLMRARWVMRFLIQLGDPRAAGALIEASRARDDTFQREIVFALGELGGEEAEAYLFTVAEGHDLPLMRQSAERALTELRSRRGRDGGVLR